MANMGKDCDRLYQLATSIEFMHIKGINHFDIKPHNVFTDKSNNIKLGDFGLSRHVEIYQITPPRTGFTLMYCSPCQLVGVNSNQYYFNDVWSYGMTVYAVLIGKSPFDEIQNIGRKMKKS